MPSPSHTSPTTSRRQLLIAGGGLITAGALPGCSFFSTDPGGGPTGGASAVDLSVKESPMLTQLVEAGTLPPLDQRLPANPLVIEPVDELGGYGGTIRGGVFDQNQSGIEDIAAAGLVEWTKTTPPEPAPGLAEAYDVLEDGRMFEFRLREGVKWSDGEPFTTDDLMFWYENMLLNTELNPTLPNWMIVGGEKMRVVAVDTHTIRFEFADTHGLFLQYMCHPGPATGWLCPKHYLGQFHPDIVGAAQARELAKENGFDSWTQHFENLVNNRWRDPNRPVLGPWKITQAPTATGAATAERNPYYWKVDTEGRQLPYIDSLTWSVLTQDPYALRAANGDLDLAFFIGYDKAPLLLRNAEERDFRVLRWRFDGGFSCIHVNQSHPDPVLRELYQNIDFRAGLSHAINRDEVNQALMAGQGEIQHPCGIEGDRYFEEGMGQRFTEFDVALANSLLDDAGLTDRSPDGFRLRPDGEPMLLTALTFPVGGGIPEVDMLEYVKRYWADVGINMKIRNVSMELFYEEAPLGEYDLNAYGPAGYLWDIDPLWYVPIHELTYWAPLYGRHYMTNGAEGIAPPGVFAELIELYEELMRTPGDDARLELGREILRRHDENVWTIGVVKTPFAPVVATSQLRNLREDAVASWRTGYPAASEPAQLYFGDTGG